MRLWQSRLPGQLPTPLEATLPASALLCPQIVETSVTPDKTEDVKTLVEFTLGQDLAHPNVVQTFERTNRVIEVGPGHGGRLMAQLQCCAPFHLTIQAALPTHLELIPSP